MFSTLPKINFIFCDSLISLHVYASAVFILDKEISGPLAHHKFGEGFFIFILITTINLDLRTLWKQMNKTLHKNIDPVMIFA